MNAGEAHRESLRSGIIPKRWRGPYSSERCHEKPRGELLRGIEEFNRGEYFDQHETLEDLWRAEPNDVRYLYQGILQVGVGLHHLQRANYPGAVSKLRSGVEKLSWFEPVCQGVDVARLVGDAARCLEALEALGRLRIGEFDWTLAPKIRIMPPS